MPHNIPIYNDQQIQQIRHACNLAQSVLVYLEPFVQVGATTLELNDLAHNYITQQLEAIPAPLNYHGFPKSICTSINDVICHGIPSNKDVLRNGDIINIDVTVIKNGYYGDTSKMFFCGEVSDKNKQLCNATQEMLYAAIKTIKQGSKLSDIGTAIHSLADHYKFGVVRNYIGHGIGNKFHHDPQVLHYRNQNHLILQPGMVFTVEPMINAGDYGDRIMRDGWTVKTKDKGNSAQYEHQILVTEYGCEIMTLREEETLINRYQYN